MMPPKPITPIDNTIFDINNYHDFVIHPHCVGVLMDGDDVPQSLLPTKINNTNGFIAVPADANTAFPGV